MGGSSESGPETNPVSPRMSKVLGELGELVLEHRHERGDDRIHVAREALLEAARRLRDSPELSFDLLVDVTAVDYLGQPDGFKMPPMVWDRNHPAVQRFQQSRHKLLVPDRGECPRFAVVYHLFSTRFYHRLRIKCRVPEDDASISSVISVWIGADWLERETYDLYGIRFIGHPDLRRIYLNDEFIGHPLRKDYAKHDEQPTQEYVGPGGHLPRRPITVRPEPNRGSRGR